MVSNVCLAFVVFLKNGKKSAAESFNPVYIFFFRQWHLLKEHFLIHLLPSFAPRHFSSTLELLWLFETPQQQLPQQQRPVPPLLGCSDQHKAKSKVPPEVEQLSHRFQRSHTPKNQVHLTTTSTCSHKLLFLSAALCTKRSASAFLCSSSLSLAASSSR